MLFLRLVYSRKTERYRQAVELARIILFNYHPDLKGGSNKLSRISVSLMKRKLQGSSNESFPDGAYSGKLAERELVCGGVDLRR